MPTRKVGNIYAFPLTRHAVVDHMARQLAAGGDTGKVTSPVGSMEEQALALGVPEAIVTQHVNDIANAACALSRHYQQALRARR